MKRSITISEEFGLFRVRSGDFDVSSSTLEGALNRAMERSGQFTNVESGIGFPFESAEVLDSLLGRKEGS